MQTRPSKKQSTIMRSRPAAALAPRSADVEALPQAPESLPHVLHESPRVQMKVTHSLIIDSSATASLSLTFSSLTVFVVGPVSLGPRRQASGASKAERRDADEAVKEAIDDHAEPTGCCLGPAVRRRGSPRIPAPCPRVAPRPNEGHPLSNNRLQRDGSLSLSLFSLCFVVGPVSLGPRRQASGASKAERRDADEAVKEESTIMRSRPAAALAPRSADVEALPQAPESLPHVLHESPRVQMKVTHSLIIDSSATAFSLTLTFLSLTVFVVGPVSLGPRRQAAGASKAERRDADEAVKEAIDDHAEPTGCCLGPAVRRRGSPPPGPRIPAPCPGRVAPRPNEGHPLSNNRLQRDGSLSLSPFPLSQSLWLVP